MTSSYIDQPYLDSLIEALKVFAFLLEEINFTKFSNKAAVQNIIVNLYSL